MMNNLLMIGFAVIQSEGHNQMKKKKKLYHSSHIRLIRRPYTIKGGTCVADTRDDSRKGQVWWEKRDRMHATEEHLM
jgi:hypothetical protein